MRSDLTLLHGSSIDTVVSYLGYPSGYAEFSTYKIYTWENSEQLNLVLPDVSTGYGYTPDGDYVTTTNYGTKTSSSDLLCKIVMRTDGAGIIRSSEIKGDGISCGKFEKGTEAIAAALRTVRPAPSAYVPTKAIVEKKPIAPVRLPTGFLKGDMRLDSTILRVRTGWKAGTDKKEMTELFKNGKWTELVSKFPGHGTSKSHYYMLGRAAEGLGSPKGALVYYELAQSSFYRCDGCVMKFGDEEIQSAYDRVNALIFARAEVAK